MTAIDTLTRLGFNDDGPQQFQALSDDMGLSANYPHKVLGVYTLGNVTALIEQNMSEDVSGGVEVIQKHPAILILESPKGRVAISNFDNDDHQPVIEQIVNELS